MQVSEVCLGSLTFGNKADEVSSFAVMDVAYEHGVRFIDTADVYPPPSGPALRGRAEEIIGKWLRARGTRSEIVVATKVGKPMGEQADDAGLSRKHIVRACEASLQRLGTDFIDLYQVHGPDPQTPVNETLDALDALIRAGKVRAIGCSNFPAPALLEALATSELVRGARFESQQVRYNLESREIERDILPLCTLYGVGVLAYSPLAGGRLTRTTPPGAALGWVLSQPAITSAIVGASRPEQLVQTLTGLNELAFAEDVKDDARAGA
jgi:aryl-alcohol dehydrogenase-like predicted oxidoreductase